MTTVSEAVAQHAKARQLKISMALALEPLIDLWKTVSPYFREVSDVCFRFTQILAPVRRNVAFGKCVQLVDQFQLRGVADQARHITRPDVWLHQGFDPVPM